LRTAIMVQQYYDRCRRAWKRIGKLGRLHRADQQSTLLNG
jgi:hypothetical protein